MRTVLGVAGVVFCLGLAGCSLFGKKQTAQNGSGKPFLGSASSTKTETVSMPRQPEGTPPGAIGVLAGQVISNETGKPIKALIQYKNCDKDESKEADLNIETNDEGFFVISSLTPGGRYQLIARAKQGDDLVSQEAFVQTPNPHLLLRVDKRFTSTKTPPLKDPPSSSPSREKPTGTERSQGRNSGVTIEAPIKLPSDGAETNPAADNGPGGAPPNPASIANDFNRIPQPPLVDVPSPPPLPSRSQWDSVPASPGEQPPSVPRPSSSIRFPNVPKPVPFCEIFGGRLENFALYDLDGNVWEYARNHKGRLTLLDFWYSTCPHCKHCMPRLAELHESYKDYGLEIIGIACEVGPLQQQRTNVLSVRGRYQIPYKTLLAGGGKDKDRHPVVEQFQVEHYPCLVLIDADGTILWKREGLDDNEYRRLRALIDNKLLRQPQR